MPPSTALEFLKHRRRRSSCRLAQSRRRGGAGKAVRVPKVSEKRLLFKITKDDRQEMIVTFFFPGTPPRGEAGGSASPTNTFCPSCKMPFDRSHFHF